MNWPLRTVCNNKKCNAPGPWTCTSCNNKNFQGRAVCNRKGCGLPRPATLGGGAVASPQMGNMAAMSAMNQMQMAQMGMMPMQMMPNMMMMGPNMAMANMQNMAMANAAMGKPNAAGGAPAGSWSCKECQNVNWPLRTVCNNKKCNAAGPWTCPACQNKNFQGRMVCNRSNCGQPRPDDASLQATSVATTVITGANKAHPDGSWACPACSNVNWPLRATCNRKGCDQPKPF